MCKSSVERHLMGVVTLGEGHGGLQGPSKKYLASLRCPPPVCCQCSLLATPKHASQFYGGVWTMELGVQMKGSAND